MTILGIETSCDETAIAVLEIAITKNHPPAGRAGIPKEIKVLSNIVSSQIKLHAEYGGVVPNLAAREHTKNILHVFETALKKAGISDFNKEVDLIAVTHGPGLGPALLVGLTFAKTIAMIHKKTIVGVNHMRGHIYSNWLQPIGEFSNSNFPRPRLGSAEGGQFSKGTFPILNLIVSGGHTELVLMSTEGRSASGGIPLHNFELIGETMDDAVGEAFDKVARLLGLGYPGGPAVAQRATEFKVESSKLKVEFPRPMLKSKDYNFSFSGLKTAVLYKIRDLKENGVEINNEVINEIAYAFQEAAIDVLVQKTIRAAQEYKVKSIFLSGGVSANNVLRSTLQEAAARSGFEYSCPPLAYTTDNAAMIALAGYFAYQKESTARDWRSVQMEANLAF